MTRLFTSLLFCSTHLALLASTVGAAPHRRQIGDLQCNINRAEIVFHVAELATVVNSLKASDLMGNSSSAADDLKQMQEGTAGVGGAITGILKALIAGQKAPPELRDQVSGNLTNVFLALQDVSSHDPNTVAALGKAAKEIKNAGLAGDGVVNNCT